MKTGADFIFVGSGAVELTTRKASGIVRGEGWCGNPSVLTAERFGDKKGGRGTSRKQQYKGLCLAVNPPPFDKGGKCDGDF